MRMTTGVSPVRLQQLSARQLCLLNRFNIPRCLSHWIRLLQKTYFLTCENGRKEKMYRKWTRTASTTESWDKVLLLVYVENLNVTITTQKPPNFKKYSSFSIWLHSFGRTLLQFEWVPLFTHKPKHSLKSSGFSQKQPQKIQLIYWNTCVFKILIAKIILKIRIGFLEYQFVN